MKRNEVSKKGAWHLFAPRVLLPIALATLCFFASCSANNPDPDPNQDPVIPWTPPYITSGHIIGGCEDGDCGQLARDDRNLASAEAYRQGYETVSAVWWNGEPIDLTGPGNYNLIGMNIPGGFNAYAEMFCQYYRDCEHDPYLFSDTYVGTMVYQFMAHGPKEYHTYATMRSMPITNSSGSDYSEYAWYSDGTQEIVYKCFTAGQRSKGFDDLIEKFRISHPRKTRQSAVGGDPAEITIGF